MKVRVDLTLSEAQWDLYPDQASDETATATFELPLADGPWVHFMYESFQGQGDVGPPRLWFGDGFWHYDGRVFSDVVLIIEAEDE